MMKYWAVDYIGYDCYEPILNDQLYSTQEEAYRAAAGFHEEYGVYEVTWYTIQDLLETYACDYSDLRIDDNLKVHTTFME